MKKILIIAALFVVTFFIIPGAAFASMVAQYKFDGNTNDSAGSNNGTVVGNPTYVAGVAGQAINLDGTDDCITIPSGALSGITNAVTISFWQYGSGSQPQNDVIFEAKNGSTSLMKIRVPWGDGIVYWDAGGNQTKRQPAACFYKGRWNFWTVTKNTSTGTQTLYLNGMIVNSISNATGSISGATSVRIGAAADGTSSYGGYIDDFRIYNEALSYSAINDLFKGGRATYPTPSDGGSLIRKDSTTPALTWTAASGATSHNVYFGTSYTAVRDATTGSAEYKGNQTSTSFAPNVVYNKATTYYWRIDEVTATGTIKGLVWKYTYNDWNPYKYMSWGDEASALIEQDFRIRSYNGYYEDQTRSAWSYAWPNSINLMALGNAAEMNPNMYKDRINSYFTELNAYWTYANNRYGYDCIANPSQTNRFYDDNSWLAVGLADVYVATQNSTHLQRARDAYAFALSGEDSVQGGGIYWKETQYAGDPTPMKGVSSTAGTAMAAVKLYGITGETQYRDDAVRLLSWIMTTLKDTDGVIGNSVDIYGDKNMVKWSYNTGVPLYSYARLYALTGNSTYLNIAIDLAKAAERFFVDPDKGAIIDAGCFAFTLAEGWLELYRQTNDTHWLGLADKVIGYVHDHRDPNGRYPTQWDDNPSSALSQYYLLYTAANAKIYWSASKIGGTAITLPTFISGSNITASASSSWSGREPSKTTDGSGLTGYLHDNDSSGASMWHTLAGGQGSTNPNPGTVSGAAWIKYTFNANYKLGKMWVWNLNQYTETDRGLRRVTVEYTSDGSTWQKLGDYEIPEAAGATGYPHNYEIDFGGVDARAVCITANTSGGNWGDSGPYYGLSEVKFGLYDPCLQGWWKMNSATGTTAFDSSGRGNNGTVTGASWNGGALSMDGSGDYLTIPVAALSNVTSRTTVTFWQYGNSQTGNTIFQATNSGDGRVISANLPWLGTIYWDTAINNRISKTASSAETTGEWVFWAFTKDAVTGQQKIYRNGVLWHSGTGLTGNISGSTATAFRIGSDTSGGTGYSGLVDDFRLYNTALNDGDILKLYQQGSK